MYFENISGSNKKFKRNEKYSTNNDEEYVNIVFDMIKEFNRIESKEIKEKLYLIMMDIINENLKLDRLEKKSLIDSIKKEINDFKLKFDLIFNQKFTFIDKEKFLYQDTTNNFLKMIQ
jgi:hypothetical protein